MHELDVELDPHTRALRVDDVLQLRGTGAVEVSLDAGLHIAEATLDGHPLGEGRRRGALRVHHVDLSGVHRLHLRYEGKVAPLAQTDHRGTLEGLVPMADARGSYLPAGTGWYPMVGEAPLRYRLTLRLPPGQRGLVPGRQLEESDGVHGYRARYAVDVSTDGIDLMAGPYVVDSRTVEVAGKRVRLRTWFHPEIAELSSGYLDDSVRYVERYSARVGAYPFDEFGVVSSPLPTGFGMPTLAYLGVEVLRLPFIRATSLGHEVLHNWWGNGVYVDYASGNWAEGLTTFLADYAYEEAEGADAARTMRLDWLRDFAAIPEQGDAPLRTFTSRTHGTSQIVGYNKAAFVFHMLRARIGVDAFEHGLRRFWDSHRFRRASWDDLRRAFQDAAGEDLTGFFAQWLDRAGAPRLRLQRAQRRGDDLVVELIQGMPPYVLDVPVEITDSDTNRRHAVLRMTDARQTFVVPGAGRADAVVLDPGLNTFRLLDSGELPPILRNAMVDPRTRLLIASDDADFQTAARELANSFLDHPPSAEADSGPLLLIAPLDRIDALLSARGLPAAPAEVGTTGSARVWTARDGSATTILVIAARDAQAVAALRRALPHYGRQSWLVFEGARAIARGTWPVRAQRLNIQG